MRVAYKFRVRPMTKQHQALHACLRSHRQMYNAALEERREAWRKCGVSVTYGMQSAQLTEIRAESPEQARWSFLSQQATLRRLNKAMAAFLPRVKAQGPAGYPRFKGPDRFDSVEWPQDGDGCRFKPEARRVYLESVGDVKVDLHRPMEGNVKTITLKREGRRWYVIVSCDELPTRPLPATGAVVGPDVGITAFLATSDGALIHNPRHGHQGAARLQKAQQGLARRKRGSSNRRAAKAVAAHRHRKVANQRRDVHHKLARGLVGLYDVIAVEDLAVKNMSRSAAGSVGAPGSNVAQKTGLNRLILDAGWARFRSILTGKEEEAGRMLIAVNPRYTSRTCASCGHVDAANRDGALFGCRACGHVAHADINAARNILRAGLARLAGPESGVA